MTIWFKKEDERNKELHNKRWHMHVLCANIKLIQKSLWKLKIKHFYADYYNQSVVIFYESTWFMFYMNIDISNVYQEGLSFYKMAYYFLFSINAAV